MESAERKARANLSAFASDCSIRCILERSDPLPLPPSAPDATPSANDPPRQPVCIASLVRRFCLAKMPKRCTVATTALGLASLPAGPWVCPGSPHLTRRARPSGTRTRIEPSSAPPGDPRCPLVSTAAEPLDERAGGRIPSASAAHSCVQPRRPSACDRRARVCIFFACSACGATHCCTAALATSGCSCRQQLLRQCHCRPQLCFLNRCGSITLRSAAQAMPQTTVARIGPSS